MTTVGSCEAKTKLPQLLRAVERGETVTITRRGEAVARIVGVRAGVDEPTAAVIERIKVTRSKRPSVTVEDVLAARDEGRRFCVL